MDIVAKTRVKRKINEIENEVKEENLVKLGKLDENNKKGRRN